ncbi:snRNA-activating protein complex subunit 1-like [Tachypleus tridentatus]|uniref:snRNA-activating protein complex subunit 1-like n=1 Tax=Tachypleus tridentatus TaxID=6853 RepID=UPI003FD48240
MPSQGKNFAAGVQTDVDALMKKFVEKKSIRYEEFAKIWKEMKFSSIFLLKDNERELLMFTRECFTIAMNLWTINYSFQEQVTGLYLLYGFYVKQSLNPPVKIRITLEQWKQLRDIFSIATREHHLDICFIVHRLQLMNAFHFVATPTMMGPKSSLRLNGISEVQETSRLDDVMMPLHELKNCGHLEQLQAIHEHYTKMKEAQSIESVQTLNIVSGDIYEEINEKIKQFQEKYKYSNQDSTFEEGDINDEEEENIGARRARLRAQQFSSVATVSQSRRHRPVQKDDSSDCDKSPIRKKKQ